MLKPSVSALCIILSLAFLFSCSAGESSSPVVPPEELTTSADSGGGTMLLASWQVVIDPDSGTADVIGLRSCNLILNVLQFLEPPVLTGLTIANLTIDPGTQTVEVDVTINHSMPSTKLKIFDTRGVVYGPEIANTDGLTILTSPEFFKDVPFGYRDGLLGTKDEVVNYEGMATFKYFADGLGAFDDLVEFMSDPLNVANRGVFSEGPNTLTRHYVLDWNNVTYPWLAFNYSIYANWTVPDGDPPYELADYPISTANCQEVVCVSVTEIENTLWYSGGVGGGDLSLQIEAWDWQGNIQDVSILGPGIPDRSGTPAGSGNTVYSYFYDFTNIPVIPEVDGDLEILITIVDPVTYGEAWIANLLPTDNPMYGEQITSLFFYTTTVSPEAPATMDLVIDYRPFAVNIDTGLMNTDATFNTTIGIQNIGLFLRNNGPDLVPGVIGEISFPLSGIVPIKTIYAFGDMEPGAEVLGIFTADFTMATPGKYDFRLNLTADGFADEFTSRKAFVATYTVTGWSNFTVAVPQGTITANYLDFTWGPNLENIGGPTSFQWIVDPVTPYTGQFSPIPFDDPWWKAFAAGFTAVMGLAYAVDGIVEMCGGDLLSPGAEKVVVGLATAGGVAIATDYKDLFRRGQENTMPAPTELTIQEEVNVTATYDLPPVAGEPFTGQADWTYTRITDGGSYSYSTVETFINFHHNTGRIVLINDTEYTNGDTFEVTASLQGPDGMPYVNSDAYMFADIAVKVSGEEIPFLMLVMFDDGTHGDIAANDGLYTATRKVDESWLPGTYTWGVYTQDVNHALATDPPLVAAGILGGLMVGHPMPQPPQPPAMCGLVNDGEFTVI